MPGGCPGETGTTGSHLAVAQPRRRYTASPSARPRQEGDSGEGQLRLLPSFLISPVKTISSRSIGRRRRIKLPRHNVRLQRVSPRKPGRPGCGFRRAAESHPTNRRRPGAAAGPRASAEASSLSVFTTTGLLDRGLCRKNRKERRDQQRAEPALAAVHVGSCGLRPCVLRSRNSGRAAAPTA